MLDGVEEKVLARVERDAPCAFCHCAKSADAGTDDLRHYDTYVL
jgi:hypothetical protein